MSVQKMYICPICHEPGISAAQKASMGAMSSMQCHNCGKKVGISWKWAILGISPIVLGGIISYMLSSDDKYFLIICIIALLITSVIWRHLPLVSKEK